MNLLKEFQALHPRPPLWVGEIVAISGELRTITLLDGSQVTARGAGAVGQKVFLRDGQIEGEAPDLPLVQIVI